MLKYAGIRSSYLFLRFVTVYYFLFYPRSFSIIYSFYSKRLGFGPVRSVIYIYRNYYSFGQVLLDKIAIMAGFSTKFKFTFEGEEYLRRMVEEKTGGLLISAHIGNFEMAGYMLERLKTRVNIIMYDAEHETIKNFLSTIINRNFNIIVIKEDNSHIYEINRAFLDKEIVCIHGDRYVKGSKTMTSKFLGGNAKFPTGPFYMAMKYNIPVSFVFAMKESSANYHFTASPPEYFQQQGIQIRRNEVILTIIKKYIGQLEKMIRKYPTQWFNYYNFWAKDE